MSQYISIFKHLEINLVLSLDSLIAISKIVNLF